MSLLLLLLLLLLLSRFSHVRPLLNIPWEAKSSLVEKFVFATNYWGSRHFKIVKQIGSALEEIICTIVDFLVFKTYYDCLWCFIGGNVHESEKAMAPHSSTLAWQIPWMEEPGRLQSMGSLGVRHDWATSLSLFTFMHWRRKWQPTPLFLPGESQGRGSLVGCRLWGRTEMDTTEVT